MDALVRRKSAQESGENNETKRQKQCRIDTEKGHKDKTRETLKVLDLEVGRG